MTDIFTPEYAAQHCGEVLRSSPQAQEGWPGGTGQIK